MPEVSPALVIVARGTTYIPAVSVGVSAVTLVLLPHRALVAS